jgi:hypothetical protein
MNINAPMSNILGLPFSAGLIPTSYELPAELSVEQWLDVGRVLGRVRGSVMWWIGDWWAYGEHRYGDRNALVESEENGIRFACPGQNGIRAASAISPAAPRSRGAGCVWPSRSINENGGSPFPEIGL